MNIHFDVFEGTMQRRYLVFVGIFMAVAATAFIGSPYYAASSLKDAALAGDIDALESKVDFPAVRDSLKSQMTVALTVEFQNDPKMKGNPFAGLGLMMMPAIIEKAVGAYVTPEGISALVKGAKPGAAASSEAKADIDYETEYSGLDRFRVHTKKKSDGEAGPTFLFQREGWFSWKMIKIELPENFLKKPASAAN